MYVSAGYSSVGSTIALYILHFVEILISCCDYTRFQSPQKAPEAAWIRFLISTSMVLSDATVLPMYVKFLINFSGVLKISTCGSIEVWPGGGW